MDTWPGYAHLLTPKEKGKGKIEDRTVESPWRYPVLDHGTLGAATLARAGTSFEWTFAAQNEPEQKLVPSSSSSVEVFPPTRPEPWRSPAITPSRRATQGAQFLRTFFPDVDIPTKLIRKEIIQDAHALYPRDKNDMNWGNISMLEVASFQTYRKSIAYLAFPMGETNCHLNMSPLVTYAGREAELRPLASPVHTFATPIRQIVTIPDAADIGKGKPAPMLSVRTMGATAFLQLNLSTYRNTHSLSVTPLFSVERSDIGDRHAVDIALPTEDVNTGYIANDLGDIYRCVATNDGRSIERLHHSNNTEPVFCRLATSDDRQKIIKISERKAVVLDARTGIESHELYTLSHPGIQFTSIERPDDDYIIRSVTTKDIMWLDERHTKRPLLSVKHARAFDTTLRTHTYVLKNGPLTFLTTRRNSLVTVYDVRRGDDSLLHIHGSPYALPPLSPNGSNFGYALFEPTAENDRLSILQLSERGSVSLLNMAYRPARSVVDAATEGPRRGEWPYDVKALIGAKTDLGILAPRANSVVDMSTAYERIFVDREGVDLSAQTDAVFDTLERMPTFWQNLDAPVEHALTTYDIALRAGSDPAEESRSDWFTGSTLDTVAGYRVLEQGRIPHDNLKRVALGHWDISSHIRRHAPEFEDEPRKTIEHLMRYNLADDPERNADSFRRENEARTQLALDLALAADVFLPRRLEKDVRPTFDEDIVNISLSTQAMSLGDLDPPPVQFGYLRLAPKKSLSPVAEEDDESSGDRVRDRPQPSIPLGVRLLLQEWDVGAKPEQYVYRDPYDDLPAVSPNVTRRSAKEPGCGGSSQETKAPTQPLAQRPPVVGSSVPLVPPVVPANLPAPTRKPLVAARSLDALAMMQMPPSQPTGTQDATHSQELLPSTQVLPGPHGGRAGTIKKPVKKRLGGF